MGACYKESIPDFDDILLDCCEGRVLESLNHLVFIIIINNSKLSKFKLMNRKEFKKDL
jgi:hypothetical protein